MRFRLRFWPFTIKAYALGFIILMSLSFWFLNAVMQDRLDAIRAEAQAQNMKAAQDELDQAVARVASGIKQLAESLASQDETRQQLANPAYYGYWRDNRALGGLLPNFTNAVEIYDRQGKALAPQPINNMPAAIGPEGIGRFVGREGNRAYLYIFQPVRAVANVPASVQGYLGIKIDFLGALKEEYGFGYVNADSIQLEGGGQSRLPAEQVARHLTFQLKANPESAALLEFLSQSRQNIIFILIVLSIAFFFILHSLLAAPLRSLSLHIDTLRAGRSTLLQEGFSHSLPVAELEKVRMSLNDYQNQLENMHRSLNEKNDELWLLAHRDPLTGIFNRRCFEDDWEQVLAVASGHRLIVSFILFDCDQFKAINDSYGHQAGDQVLQAIARILQDALRHGDRLYRLGGDEFATIFLDTDPALAAQAAQRCIEQTGRHDFSGTGVKEPVRISVGLAHASGNDPDSLAILPKQADVAMYHAKRPGRHKLAIFDDGMTNDAGILFSTRANNAVFEAMASGESIEMHYQPVVNLVTGEVDYYEALVRIRDGQELIMPSSIFPIIEARRLEAEFDLAIIERIAQDLAQGRIPPDTGVSLNVSGPGVINPAIIQRVMALGRFLDRYRLVVEVTETALITQLHQASANLNRLRQDGFKIALDDFGSGYSSLGYLASMPVDIIKFDISMIRHLDAGGRQGVIVENLAAMVVKAGYHLVAEGIETGETLKKVARQGFARGQGYLFGRPGRTCEPAAKVSFFDTTL
ncbi:MAG: bifunctional diguanylate cyclase/phosphodiesterase [Sulfuricella sp.]|nr:bifunctional diguanylate cyclase/phosphodiesterase [Sulfuricella sp.]